jgi:hypothetical protein
MKKILTSLVALLLLFTAKPASAGVVTAEVDKTVGTTDDQFVYVITVSGDLDEDPRPPVVSGLQFQSTGKSSSMSWVNGKSSSEVEFSFMVIAEKEGTYTIPAMTLKVDGKKESSAPITLKISNSASGSAQSQNQGGGSAAPEPTGSGAIFIERELSKKDPYVGEQVISTVRIYTREQLYEAGADKDNFQDLQKYAIDGKREYAKVIDGQEYSVIEISEILVPLKAGPLQLPPFSLRVKVAAKEQPRQRQRGLGGFFSDEFFGRRRLVEKVIKSNTVAMKVQALPKTNRPADYFGLVGSFELDAGLNTNEVNTGDPVTLTVVLRGEGVTDGLDKLSLNLDPQIKIYPDKPTEERTVDQNKGIYSTKTFKFALVPTKPGKFDLGKVRVPVFIPKIGSYVELTADVGSLTATGEAEKSTASGGPDTAASSKLQVKQIREDLIGIHREVEHPVTKSEELGTIDIVMLAFMNVASFGLLGFSYFWARAQTRKGASQKEKRRSRAFRKFKKSYDELTMAQVDLAALTSLFKEYIGDKFNVKGLALTEKEVYELVTHGELSPELNQKALAVVNEFSQVEYGGKRLSVEEFKGLATRVLDIVKEVERRC